MWGQYQRIKSQLNNLEKKILVVFLSFLAKTTISDNFHMRNHVLIMGFLILMIILMSSYDGIRSDKVYATCLPLIKHYLTKAAWHCGHLYFFSPVWSFTCLSLLRLCLNLLLHTEHLNGSWSLCICKTLYTQSSKKSR